MKLVFLAFALVCFLVAAVLFGKGQLAAALTNVGLAFWVASQFLV